MQLKKKKKKKKKTLVATTFPFLEWASSYLAILGNHLATETKSRQSPQNLTTMYMYIPL